MNQKTYTTDSATATTELGRRVGERLKGGEVLEFLSDLGGGKTMFVKGLAEGFGSPDPVASPSFTISFVYTRPDAKRLYHFDFYRLEDAGIVAGELAEVEGTDDTVVAVEWGEIVHDVLPKNRIIIEIISSDETVRKITCKYPADFAYLFMD